MSQRRFRAASGLAAWLVLLTVAGSACASARATAAAPAMIDVELAGGAELRLGPRRSLVAPARVAALLAAHPQVEVRRLFGAAGASRPRLAGFVRLRVPAGVDAAALGRRLAALPQVVSATPVPRPLRPPSPDFSPGQGYRGAPEAGGVGAIAANGIPGGTGGNVRIVDIEDSWNTGHEDLSRARVPGALIANDIPCDPFASDPSPTDHGTAVLGELAADDDGSGVTGLAPAVSLGMVNASSLDPGSGQCSVWNVANAVAVATAHTRPGDVILIEQQTDGPNWPGGDAEDGLVPVEWNPAVRAAILDATDRGRIVVEAAANGYEDLDAPVYDGWFSRDTGAILVGAGNAPGCTAWGDEPARGRLAFSNHGSAVDLQGWGACVTTTGYGDLQGAPLSLDAWYTSAFGGTSSASPIVAGSAAILSSIARARATTLTPAGVRSILRDTGRPQVFGLAGDIGPLPDLGAAVAATPSAVTGDAGALTARTATLAGAITPGAVPTSYRFEFGTTSAYDSQTPEATLGAGDRAVPVSAELAGLEPGTTYHFRIAALRDGMVIATGADGAFATPAAAPEPQPAPAPAPPAPKPATGGTQLRLTRAGAERRARSALATRYGRRWRTRSRLRLRCVRNRAANDFTCTAAWTSGRRRLRAGVRVRVVRGKVAVTVRALPVRR